MKYFYAIIKPKREDFMTNPSDEDNQIMSEHFQYLKGLLDQDKLLIAGPTLIETDPFGLIIVKSESESEAKAMLENDPSIKSGIQSLIDFRPFAASLVGKK
ncbi:MAG: hypothetical protein INQ03_22555 [Candidatus Heimdallarchaeota archaeon]|nr:hypothetical protein [Candidatus Heimdallarchaeota archaeon]